MRQLVNNPGEFLFITRYTGVLLSRENKNYPTQHDYSLYTVSVAFQIGGYAVLNINVT